MFPAITLAWLMPGWRVVKWRWQHTDDLTGTCVRISCFGGGGASQVASVRVRTLPHLRRHVGGCLRGPHGCNEEIIVIGVLSGGGHPCPPAHPPSPLLWSVGGKCMKENQQGDPVLPLSGGTQVDFTWACVLSPGSGCSLVGNIPGASMSIRRATLHTALSPYWLTHG